MHDVPRPILIALAICYGGLMLLASYTIGRNIGIWSTLSVLKANYDCTGKEAPASVKEDRSLYF